MQEEKLTVTCLLSRGAEYYTGDGWSSLGRACLYTLSHAAQKKQELLPEEPGIRLRCVIQNKLFNYYDGKDFVDGLSEAQFYSPEEAESELKKLSG